MKIVSTLYRVNGVYYLKWTEGGKERRRSLRTRNAKEAKATKQALDAELRHEAFAAPAGVQVLTVTDALARHVAQADLSDSSISAMNLAGEYWKELTGNPPISELRKHHLISFRTDMLGRNYSLNYTLRLIGCIQTALNTLVNGEVIEANPFHGIRSLKRKKARPRFLDWPECQKILATAKAIADERDPAGGYPFTGFALGFYSGLRRSEILSAKWEHIEGDRMYVEGTKTEASAAYVPYHDTLAAALTPYRKESGYIVKYADGRRPSLTNFWRTFESVVNASGVTAPDGVAWHLLRHSFAVHLVRDLGYTLEQLAPLLRHADYASVTALYADIRAMKGKIDRF